MINTIELPEYCERMAEGFFGEPINLFTNLFFIVSAAFAWRMVSNSPAQDKTFLQVLSVLIGLIGIGSFIFHGYPNQITILFDAVPIYIFLALVLIYLFKKLTNSWLAAFLFVSAFAAVLIAATLLLPTELLNGSIRHILILAVGLIIVALLYRKCGRVSLGLLPPIILYSVAIIARTIDQNVCSTIHLGTHFLWHSLAALASFYLMDFLMKLSRRTTYKL